MEPSSGLDSLTDARRWRGLIAVIVTVAITGVILGLFNPLIALRLERMGVSTTWNGINAAMPAIAAIVVAPLLPRLTAWLGLLRSILLGALLTLAVIPLFTVFTDLWVWFVLRFVMGLGGMIHWVTSEIWLNAAVKDAYRGRVIGASTALFSVGMACGPLVLGMIGIEGALPFFISAAIVAFGIIPLVFAIGAAPEMHGQQSGTFLDACRRAPTPMMASLTEGFLFVALLVLLPLYALRNGFAETTAIAMLSVIVIGQIVASIPIGWLADHMDRRVLLLANGVVALLCCLALPAVLASPTLLLGVLFLWGASSAGMYTVGLVRLGAIFKPRELGPATAVFILVTQIGSVAGPIVGGAGMDLWDPHGFIVVTALGCGLFCVFAAWRYLRMRRP